MYVTNLEDIEKEEKKEKGKLGAMLISVYGS